MENEKLCIKNEEFCAKNEDFCIENDGFCRRLERERNMLKLEMDR